jgi:hypothetical protein
VTGDTLRTPAATLVLLIIGGCPPDRQGASPKRPVTAPPHLPRSATAALVQTGGPPSPVVLDRPPPGHLGLRPPCPKAIAFGHGVSLQAQLRRTNKWRPSSDHSTLPPFRSRWYATKTATTTRLKKCDAVPVRITGHPGRGQLLIRGRLGVIEPSNTKALLIHPAPTSSRAARCKRGEIARMLRIENAELVAGGARDEIKEKGK